MTEELKTCPFCGGTDIMSFDTGAHWVSCQTCGAEGPVVDDREDAVAKWNERQTVVVAQGQKSEPYGWHAAANGLFSVDKRCADVWKHHMGLDVTPVYAAPLAEQPTTSDGALDVVDILAMGLCAKTAIKNGGAGHGCWWELGIEAKDAFRAAATNLLDRQSPAVGGKKLHKSMWQQPEYDPELSLLGAVKEMAAPQDGPECPSQPVSDNLVYAGGSGGTVAEPDDDIVRKARASHARLETNETYRETVRKIAEAREKALAEAVAERERLRAQVEQSKAAIAELAAMVRGECPSLLNEDSGGNAKLALEIEAILALPSTNNDRPTCKLCGLEDGACICRSIPPQDRRST